MFYLPLQWYSVILLVIPGMIAALLINFRTPKEKERDIEDKKEREDQKAEKAAKKDKIKRSLRWFQWQR